MRIRAITRHTFIATLLVFVASATSATAAGVGDGGGAGWGADYSTTNTGSSVTVGGTHTKPGGSGTTRPPAAGNKGSSNNKGGNTHRGTNNSGTGKTPSNTGATGGNGGTSRPGALTPGVVYRAPGASPIAVSCVVPGIACQGGTTPKPGPTPGQQPAPAAPAAPVSYPAVTMSDLASFSPHAPVTSTEPAGVGVVGMPVNMYATASTHTLRGTVLGYPVQVRFTPHHYVFDYGDGAVTQTATGGASWATARLAQFSATPTSHVYRARGVYRPTSTVAYTASVAFADGVWHAVSGYVTATTAPPAVHVYEARTALVAHTCAVTPTGPGC